jgi:D-alanyl-D-alanine dipeptidase
VISDHWKDQTGFMYLYDCPAAGQPWQLHAKFPISLGRNGMAWGIGIYPRTPSRDPIKHEGDNCSPAGVFAIPTAFGYGSPPSGRALAYPYMQLTASTYGISDPDSTLYNRIIDANRVTVRDWKSAETMRRKDNLYRMGFLVDHNPPHGPQHPGYGSCIFLHIWRGPGSPTAGCTAMAKPSMVGLFSWIKADDKPVLVQLPKSEYLAVRDAWALPEVPQTVVSSSWQVVGLLFIFATLVALFCGAMRGRAWLVRPEWLSAGPRRA